MGSNYTVVDLPEFQQRLLVVDVLLSVLKLLLADSGTLSDPITRKSARDTAQAAIAMAETWQRSARAGGSKENG